MHSQLGWTVNERVVNASIFPCAAPPAPFPHAIFVILSLAFFMVMPVPRVFFLFGVSSSYTLPVHLHYPNATLTYLVLMNLFCCQSSDVFVINSA